MQKPTKVIAVIFNCNKKFLGNRNNKNTSVNFMTMFCPKIRSDQFAFLYEINKLTIHCFY